ncbi:MAG: tRNA 2-selenouridine(34) synthase MnmH, partial [Burkholderiales bacterium PBB5]
MPLRSLNAPDALDVLSSFDTVIDVRSPAEFAEDHLPGAVNWPVLSNEERITVGTLYVQTSPLEARKLGAALVARNIANHLDQWVRDRPRHWQPLVYCWRGGQRSGTMAWFLDQIGFRTTRLDGGYKGYRAQVRADLAIPPTDLRLTVLAGRTGSGKTRLLPALAAEGAQVLDLEALACHRGSILGGLPGQPQPSQKRFDSLLWSALRALDTSRPVFVESESKQIGRLQLPAALVGQQHGPGRVRRV